MYLFLNIVYQYNVYNLFLVGLEAQNRKGTEGGGGLGLSIPSLVQARPVSPVFRQ